MNVATILKEKGPKVVTVKPDNTLLEVANALAAQGIGAALVVDGPDQIRGIVSERDIVKAISRAGAECLKMTAASVMSSPVRTCRLEDSIDHVMGMMTTGRFRHVPVVDQRRLIGIVSIGDVVKLKIAETELEVASMRDYIAAH